MTCPVSWIRAWPSQPMILLTVSLAALTLPLPSERTQGSIFINSGTSRTYRSFACALEFFKSQLDICESSTYSLSSSFRVTNYGNPTNSR